MSGAGASGARFEPVYEHTGGLSVRLETAPRLGASGAPYTHHRLLVADGRTGAVILAVRGDELLLVRSFRASVGEDLWELPRGAGDAADARPGAGMPFGLGADAAPSLVTGVRELGEETGYRAARAELLGEYVIDSTVLPQRMGVVVCELTLDAEPGPTDGEVDELGWFSWAQVRAFVREGTIADAHSLSALARWFIERDAG